MAGVKLDNSLHKNGIKVDLVIEKLEFNLIERIFCLVFKKKYLAGRGERAPWGISLNQSQVF